MVDVGATLFAVADVFVLASSHNRSHKCWRIKENLEIDNLIVYLLILQMLVILLAFHDLKKSFSCLSGQTWSMVGKPILPPNLNLALSISL